MVIDRGVIVVVSCDNDRIKGRIMAPIPIDVPGWDSRWISWWQRTITWPRCIHFNQWMKEVEWPYERLWECKRCSQFTLHSNKPGRHTFRTAIIREWNNE